MTEIFRFLCSLLSASKLNLCRPLCDMAFSRLHGGRFKIHVDGERCKPVEFGCNRHLKRDLSSLTEENTVLRILEHMLDDVNGCGLRFESTLYECSLVIALMPRSTCIARFAPRAIARASRLVPFHLIPISDALLQ